MNLDSKMVIGLNKHAERDWLLNDLVNNLSFLNTGFVVGNDLVLIVHDDIFQIAIGLDHLLMMAAALDGASGPDLLPHEGKNAHFAPGILILEFLEVFLDERDIFDSFIEVPHSYLLVALLLVAVADSFFLLPVYSEQGPARPGAFKVGSARGDVRIFVHLLII